MQAIDQAQMAADLFLSAAWQRQQQRAQALPEGTPGVCSNCTQRCLPMAVYCDEECRADHERRERVHARMRTSLG